MTNPFIEPSTSGNGRSTISPQRSVNNAAYKAFRWSLSDRKPYLHNFFCSVFFCSQCTSIKSNSCC